jgi:hypothetical protein
MSILPVAMKQSGMAGKLKRSAKPLSRAAHSIIVVLSTLKQSPGLAKPERKFMVSRLTRWLTQRGCVNRYHRTMFPVCIERSRLWQIQI